VPSVEVALDGLLAVAIAALLASHRRARREQRLVAPAISLTTGFVLGLVSVIATTGLVSLALMTER